MTQKPSLPALSTYCRRGIEYRRWTKAHKRRIVEESYAPGASVSVVARRNDVNANQVFTWRKLYAEGKLDVPAEVLEGFVPVGVIGKDGAFVGAPAAIAPPVEPSAISGLPSSVSSPLGTTASITLSLRDGVQVRMEGEIGLAALQCVLRTALGQP